MRTDNWVLRESLNAEFYRASDIEIEEVGGTYIVNIIDGKRFTPPPHQYLRSLRMMFCAYGQSMRLRRVYHEYPDDNSSSLLLLWEVSLFYADIKWNNEECFGYRDGNDWVIDWNHCKNMMIKRRYGW